MKYLTKLPNFIQSPSGLEWVLFRKTPLIFSIGVALPCLPMLILYFSNDPLTSQQQQTIYELFGVLLSVWFFVGAMAIGCIVVMLMKGPAYVADPYELPVENKSLEQYPD